MNGTTRTNIIAMAATAVLAAAWGNAAGEIPFTARGSSAAEAFGEAARQGLTVVVVDGGRSLVTPAAVRGQLAKGPGFVAAVAEYYGLRMAWSGDKATVVLYPATAADSPPVIESAVVAWRTGWARDVRAIPALVAACGSKDPELAWQASLALQRLGWAATLALGGEAAWDWRVAAADRELYRGRQRLDAKGSDYLAFLQAAGESGRLPAGKPRELLDQALRHWHKSVRGHAILAAGRLPASEASALLDRALADRSREVRLCAVEAAGRLAALPVLEKLVANPSLAIRYRAVEALGLAGGDQATALLDKTLVDPDPGMRRLALAAVTTLGGERAFRTATELAAKKDGDLALRRQAMACLAATGGEKALDLLTGLLADGNAGLRFAAVSGLGAAGAKALPLLAKAVADPDGRVAAQAVALMGRIGGPEAIKLLEAALGDKDEDIRAAAATALGEVGGQSVLPILRKALADPDPEVRAAAATGLGRSGTAEALPLLEGGLVDRDIGVRADVATALADFSAGNDRLWTLLDKALADTEPYVCGKAIAAAAALGGPKALAALKTTLGRPAGDVRVAAVAALGACGGPAALPLLSPLLDDKDAGVRAAAAEAVGSIGGPEALAPLEKLLGQLLAEKDGRKRLDPERRRVVEAAARAIARVGGGKALAALLNGLNVAVDPDRALLVDPVGELGGADGDGNTALAALEKSLARPRKSYERTFEELEAICRLHGADRARVLGDLEKFELNQEFQFGRMFASRGLGRLGGEDAAQLLTQGREFSEKLLAAQGTVHPEIVPLVEAAGEVEAVDLLRTMAGEFLRKRTSHTVETGLAALQALNDFAGEEDLKLLAGILATPFDDQGTLQNLNFAAADILGAMGGARARDVLIAGMGEGRKTRSNVRLRAYIVTTLATCFPGDSVAAKVVQAAAAAEPKSAPRRPPAPAADKGE